MEYKEWLKNKDLEYKDGILHFAGVNTVELGEKFRTPFYVINEEMIKKRYIGLKKILDSEYKKNEIQNHRNFCMYAANCRNYFTSSRE
jgi:diaminopimelate decarboxylase